MNIRAGAAFLSKATALCCDTEAEKEHMDYADYAVTTAIFKDVIFLYPTEVEFEASPCLCGLYLIVVLLLPQPSP